MAVIEITDLERAAKKYEPTLQVLPFEVMGTELAKLGVNLVDVSNKDTLVQFHDLYF